MALTRTQLYIEPVSDTPAELVVGRDAAYGFTILEANGRPRDLTGDTLEVAAKATTPDPSEDMTTYTFDADADQVNNRGLAVLNMPAAEHTLARVGPVVIDLVINNRVFDDGRRTIELKESDA